jgi:transcriptional regulator with XRE-family HTH domain
MTLGDVIKKYRKENDISQRDFAKMTGLSNSYISQLEKNKNSKNGQPIKPTLDTFKVVADAMNINVDALLNQVDDMVISLSQLVTDGNELDNEIMNLVRQLPDNLKESLHDILQSLVRGARMK